MNKKMILALTLVLVLGVGAGMGTMALYSKQFKTEGNQVAAATFEPGLGSEQSISTNGNFYPGQTQTINLNYDNSNSDVATVFTVNEDTLEVTIGGESYDVLVVNAPRAVEVAAGGTEVAKLTVEWPSNDGTGSTIEEGNSLSNDALKAGKNLKVFVDVVATQSN